MKWINPANLNVSQEWVDKSIEFERTLETLATDQERSEFIDVHRTHWGGIKSELERVSWKKCWYCETNNLRHNTDIDHYRPKKRVQNLDGTSQTGYWWLAFDHTNFRLSCRYCNSLNTNALGVTKGKGDKFPVSTGSRRATSISELQNEEPLILDPTNPSDPSLLWFRIDGEACPKHSEGFPQMKAAVSIDALNLNDPELVEARRLLSLHCKRVTARIDKAFSKLDGSPEATANYNEEIREMLELIDEKAAFSAAARACFLTYGEGVKWIQQTVLG